MIRSNRHFTVTCDLSRLNTRDILDRSRQIKSEKYKFSELGITYLLTYLLTLRCVIPVVCVTNGREENVVKQHN